MDQTDEELVKAYLQGEPDAYNTLVARHLNGVYTYAMRFVGNEHEAEDVAQETFIKAWNNLKKYHSSTSKFKTWLQRIAHNTAIDFLRKKKHVPFSAFETEGVNTLAETVPSDDASAEELFAGIEDQAAVQIALQKLTPKHREVLLLYYTGDSTFEEIGAILGESTNTVKSRHRRALRSLAEQIRNPAANAPKNPL